MIGASRPWRDGSQANHFAGDHFCGEPEWFLSGSPEDAPNVVPEFCCQQPFHGRMVFTGNLETFIGDQPFLGGKAVLGGAAEAELADQPTLQGQLVFTGSVEPQPYSEPDVKGKLTFRGNVSLLSVLSPSGVGGQLEFSGNASAASGPSMGTVGGQLEFSGNASAALQELVGENMNTVWADEGVIMVGGAQTIGVDPLQAYNAVCYQFPAANGDTREWKFFLPAGVYTLYYLTVKASSYGKVDFYVDGVLQFSGQDFYAPSNTYNWLNGGAVTILADGLHTLRTVVNGKNASSSGYFFVPTKFWFGA